MGDTWSTWHCEKCQVVLPWKDGMENLKCVGCEMKAENAKLRDQLNAVVDAILHHRFQAESGVSLNVINYKLWDETAEQLKRRRAEIRKNRR
jgi:hypothetical protein